MSVESAEAFRLIIQSFSAGAMTDEPYCAANTISRSAARAIGADPRRQNS